MKIADAKRQRRRAGLLAEISAAPAEADESNGAIRAHVAQTVRWNRQYVLLNKMPKGVRRE
jgi:hypothetical protein